MTCLKGIFSGVKSLFELVGLGVTGQPNTKGVFCELVNETIFSFFTIDGRRGLR